MAVASFSPSSKIRSISAQADVISALMLEDGAATGRTTRNSATLRQRPELATVYGARPVEIKSCENEIAKGRRMDPTRAVLRWYLQGKCDLEELLLHLYFGHLSVSAVDSIVAQLWGKVSGSVLVSEVVHGLLQRLDLWLQRPIRKKYPSLFMQEVTTRPRQALGENASRLIMVGGIDEKGYYEVLGIMAAPIETKLFWESVVTKLTNRGLNCPRLVIGELGGDMATAAMKYWPNCRRLPFYSEFAQELMRGLCQSDRVSMGPLIVKLKDSSSPAEAELKGAQILRQLENTGYSFLSRELEGKLRHHLGYFDIPWIHGSELRKAEKMRSELGHVRERARVIGPIFDDQVLVQLAAAAFRRVSRATLLAAPLIQPR